jgi:hypothetical protein
MNKNTKGPTPRKSKSLISEGHLNAHLVSRDEVNIKKAYFFRYFPVSYLYKTWFKSSRKGEIDIEIKPSEENVSPLKAIMPAIKLFIKKNGYRITPFY